MAKVAHSTWEVNERSSFRWGPVNISNEDTILAADVWQKLFTTVGTWKETMRFAGDQWQFEINHPTQKSLLKQINQHLLYVLIKSITFESYVHWSAPETSPFFHPQRNLTNFCSTSKLICSLSQKSSLFPNENVTFWHLTWYLSNFCSTSQLIW